MMQSIPELVARNNYDTDKFRNGFGGFYDLCFGRVRDRVKTVLEIGIRRGGSLQFWRDYFPMAQIVGIDIDVTAVNIPDYTRIDVIRGDATSAEVIGQMLEKYKHFDVIVDDGSHFSSELRASFNLLLKSSSMYLIEDLGTQYPSILGDYVRGAGCFVEDLVRIIHENNVYPPQEHDVKFMIFASYLCCLIREQL